MKRHKYLLKKCDWSGRIDAPCYLLFSGGGTCLIKEGRVKMGWLVYRKEEKIVREIFKPLMMAIMNS
jgi:hypothetical protein